MALISCSECKAEMSNKAEKCPKCGAPAKKKMSVLTTLFIAILIVVVYRAFNADDTLNESINNDTATSVAPEAAKPTKPEWSYSNSTDTVSNKEITQASLTSLNSFEMEFPYQGGTYGQLAIRKHPRYGKDIMFMINKGQLLCTSYDGCQVSVRFDDNKPIKIKATEPDDNSSTVLFLNGYSSLLKQIKTSKVMIVEATFYKNGAKAFEFDVSNLNID